MGPERVTLNGRAVAGFDVGLSDVEPPQPRELPPLELRTAYTVKGLGIGAGGLLGYLVGGPIGMILTGFGGWFVGNTIAASAERKYTTP